MSVTEKEAYWDQHRDTLTKVRGILTADKSKQRRGQGTGYRPLSNSHPLLSQNKPKTQKPRVSPTVGRHTRTPPKQLPRLQTPPEHEPMRQKSNLRTSKYEVVPPLKPKKNAFERTAADDDSWGEDEDDDDDNNDVRRDDHDSIYPAYIAPVFSYPVYPAPHYLYPTASLPYQAPPPTQKTKKVKGRSKQAPGRYNGYRHGNDSDEEKDNARNNTNRRHHGKNNYHADRPRYGKGRQRDRGERYDDNRYVDEMLNAQPSQMFPYISTRPYYPPEVTEVLDRYQYSYVDKKEGRRSKLEKVAHAYMEEYPEFANRLVEEFVRDYLDDEMIPDLLIDVLSSHNQLPRDHPLFPVSSGVTENFVNSTVSELLRDVVNEVVNENVTSYFVDKMTSRDPFAEWLDGMIADVVRSEAQDIGRKAVLEMAEVHMEKAVSYDLIMEWVTDEIEAEGEEVVREAILEVLIDDIIDEELILPKVEDVCDEVAVETLDYYNDKARRRELQEVRDHGGDKLVDGLCLDYLLNMIANQGRVLDQNAHADKFMDNMVLNILLETLFGVDRNLGSTLKNEPLRKLHEKMVTDVGLDAVLDNLCTSLDEDLADLDEYEQSIENNGPMLGTDR